jgi:hypothetical protein
MTFRKGARGAKAVIAAVILVIATGCSERGPAGLQSALAPQQSPEFFAAAVRHFASRTQVAILVDPRPLRPEVRLDSVALGDLMPSDAQTVLMRTRVVESGGWRITDAPTDWRCVWSRVLPPPQPRAEPDSLRLRFQECRKRGPYQSLVFGLPQSGTDPAHPDRWRIRSMRMLPNGYEVADLFLENAPDGQWAVVETRVLSGVFS